MAHKVFGFIYHKPVHGLLDSAIDKKAGKESTYKKTPCDYGNDVKKQACTQAENMFFIHYPTGEEKIPERLDQTWHNSIG